MNKKYLFILFLFPITVFGFSWSRSPLGTQVTSPVTISWSDLDLTQSPFENISESYIIDIGTNDDNDYSDDICHNKNITSGTAIINIPVGKQVYAVNVLGKQVSCEDENWDTSEWYEQYFLEGDQINTIFTIVGNYGVLFGGNNINNGGDLVASVGEVSTDTFTSAFPYMVLVVGIPVAFYVAEKLIDILILRSEKKMKTYDIDSESSGGVKHTIFKERK